MFDIPGEIAEWLAELSPSLPPDKACIVDSERVLLSVNPDADVLSLWVSEHTLWEHSFSESFDNKSWIRKLYYTCFTEGVSYLNQAAIFNTNKWHYKYKH